MHKIDRVSKFTSRKWWTSVISFVTLVIIACGGTENTATQIASIIMDGGVVIGYTIFEGFVDGQSVKGGVNGEEEDK